MSVAAFDWSKEFETGIVEVDDQHQRLVGLLNHLGQVRIEATADGLADLLAEILAYADYHFRFEEDVWEKGGATAAELASHHATHIEFSRGIVDLAHDFATQPQELARLLHEFLCSWLILHILGGDMAMARRLRDRSAGVSHDAVEVDASGRDPVSSGPASRVLLAAIRRLYAALSAMNTQLRDANLLLEERVQERTRELSASNEALARERDRLAETNRQLLDARSRLLESERMVSIGQLAAGVAHEINNPIGFVSANLNTLGGYLTDILAILDTYKATEPLIAVSPDALASVRAVTLARDLDFVRDDAVALMTETRDGILRVKRIVEDLKAFACVDGGGWQTGNVLRGLESALNMVVPRIQEKAQLRRELQAVPEIHCHLGLLNQVFVNLLINAVQSIDEKGTVTVRTGTDETIVWIEVEDDGCGIAPENASRVFEPFFTTRPVGEGTGLGLFTAWNIVHQHGGHIGLDSRPGAGSRFRVVLPRGRSPRAGEN